MQEFRKFPSRSGSTVSVWISGCASTAVVPSCARILDVDISVMAGIKSAYHCATFTSKRILSSGSRTPSIVGLIKLANASLRRNDQTSDLKHVC